MPWQTTTTENAENPYAAPRSRVDAPSATGEVEPEDIRHKLAPLESSAKAIGILCFIYAAYDGIVVVYHTGWAILAKCGVIGARWPFHRSDAITVIALGALVAVTGFAAGYGLRNLRRWSPLFLAALMFAVSLQFAVLVYYEHQRGGLKNALMMLVLSVILLTPIAALLGVDLDTIFCEEYHRVVADTPHVRVRAKLSVAVKFSMAVLVLMLIGLALEL